jgi:hypothetical protein
VTAHFTWVPDNPSDLPPDCAILREHATASYRVAVPSGSGSCSNGIGQSYSGGPIGSVDSVRYTFVPFPAGHTTTEWQTSVSPESSCTTGGQYTGRLNANTFYSAQLYAVWISTTNTNNVGGLIYAEAGRKTQVRIQCALPGLIFQSWDWSASGDFVKNYEPSGEEATLVEHIGTPDWLEESPAWYYYAPGESNISCTASVRTTDMLFIDSVTATKQLTVEKVEVSGTCLYSCISGWNLAGLFSNNNPSCTYPGEGQVGMWFEVESGESSLPTHFQTGGELEGIQLVNGVWESGILTPMDTDGTYWLDTSYPYTGGGRIRLEDGELVAYYTDCDTPNIPGLFGICATTSFRFSIMYKPASEGSIYIPVTVMCWDWNGIKPGVTPQVGSPDGLDMVPSQEFPEWFQIYVP